MILPLKVEIVPAQPLNATEKIIALKLLDSRGRYVKGRTLLEMVVFDSAGLIEPSATATLSQAREGEILDGSGSAALKFATSDAGWFRCKLTVTGPGSFWVTCADTYGGPGVVESDILKVVF